MNLWQQVEQICAVHNDVRLLYEKVEIPIDVRHGLASWIETHVWELDPPAFLEGLQCQLDNLPFFTTERLTKFQTDLRGQYALNPEMLQNKIQECLNEEYRLIQEELKGLSSVNTQPVTPEVNDGDHQSQSVEIHPKWIMQLKLQSDENEQILRHLPDYQKEFTHCLEEDQKIKGVMRYQNNLNLQAGLGSNPCPEFTNKLKVHEDDVHSKIHNIGKSIWGTYSKLESKLNQIVNDLTTIQRTHLSTLIRRWKFEQQRSFIGYPLTPGSFSRIHELAENIADILWTTRQQVKKAAELNDSLSILSQCKKNDVFPSLFDKVTILLKELAQMTFLIEHQSLPIIRTDTKFYVNQWKKHLTVGSLIAQKLNPRMSPPKVRVTIINESTLDSILTNGVSNGDLTGIGELTDNIGTMEACNFGSSYFASVFRHIRLKNLFESRKKGASTADLVTDEKFFLLCTTDFNVGDIEMFQIWTVSPPVVVTSNWSQDCHAWGTLLWDYGLSSIDRRLLEVPDTASWPEILELLNTYFFNAIGVGLTSEQCQCLTKKALRSNGNLIKTFDELCKDPMESRRFSFWEWFYNCVKLVEKNFKKEWIAGHVIGFISKDEAERLLSNSSSGTFLLRFSDTILGAISVAGIMTDRKVYSLNPYNSEDLKKRCLADKMKDLIQFLILYPNILKSDAFGGARPLTTNKSSHNKQSSYYYCVTNHFTVIDSCGFWINGPIEGLAPNTENMDTDISKLIDSVLESNSNDLKEFDIDDFEKYVDAMDVGMSGFNFGQQNKN